MKFNGFIFVLILFLFSACSPRAQEEIPSGPRMVKFAAFKSECFPNSVGQIDLQSQTTESVKETCYELIEEPCDEFNLDNYIISESINHDLIIIGDDHKDTYEYINKLLPILSRSGFRNLGLEIDPTLGFNCISNKWTPMFNSLFQKAEDNGYNIVYLDSYENGCPERTIEDKQTRDSNIYQNLKNFYEQNPGTKMLVLFGSSHTSVSPESPVSFPEEGSTEPGVIQSFGFMLEKEHKIKFLSINVHDDVRPDYDEKLMWHVDARDCNFEQILNR